MSALNLIVFGEKVEHLDLIEGVVVDLLQTKWKSFIKRSYYRQLITFIVYFLGRNSIENIMARVMA